MTAKLSRSISRSQLQLDIMRDMVHISVDGFDGPIDLLLELIETQNLDITTLSVAAVADQYWSTIDSVDQIDADEITEFIAFGSKLLLVKSTALLEAPKEPEDDLEDRIDEASGELIDLLQEHKRFRDAVDLFRELEEEGARTYARQASAPKVQLPPGLEGITLDALRDAVKEAIARSPKEPEEAVIQIEPVTVNEKVQELEAAMSKRNGRLRFRPLLEACETRTEIVVLFLAVLELIKSGQLWADQETAFGDIVLSREAAPAEA
ncbi:MAG: segregation/condensation protein A [Chloroflexi bacterium]|nr:segregation/condensation protein A [Chloroflexota bacterium]